MKKKTVTKILSAVLAAGMMATLFAGCGKTKTDAGVTTEESTAEETKADETAVADTASGKDTTEDAKADVHNEDACFARGVYLNYPAENNDEPLDFFYVFTDPNTGYYENGRSHEGAPFYCNYEGKKVTFYIGGASQTEETFTVDAIENDLVTGHFEDGIKVVFEPVPDQDPDTFDAVNYLNAAVGEDYLYEDANGWTVRYDPGLFEVTPGGPVTTFVYTGESAGTNMITVTYTVDGDAKTVIDSLAKSWGDKATTGECTIPGADDVQGYRASLPTGNEGSGLYMEAIARDYMDGALIFEVTGHLSGDEEMDMAVSDALASVIDSLEFITYE